MRVSALLIAGFALPALSGCLATRQEIEDLRADIIRLNTTLQSQQKKEAEFQSALQENQEGLQGNQADLMNKMGELTHSLEALSSQLVESDDRMTTLATRLDDLDKNVSNRLDAVVKTVQGRQKHSRPVALALLPGGLRGVHQAPLRPGPAGVSKIIWTNTPTPSRRPRPSITWARPTWRKRTPRRPSTPSTR
jgi:septal ring factor EnvC (AmiA/AmiB activator)